MLLWISCMERKTRDFVRNSQKYHELLLGEAVQTGLSRSCDQVQHSKTVIPRRRKAEESQLQTWRSEIVSCRTCWPSLTTGYIQSVVLPFLTTGPSQTRLQCMSPLPNMSVTCLLPAIIITTIIAEYKDSINNSNNNNSINYRHHNHNTQDYERMTAQV